MFNDDYLRIFQILKGICARETRKFEKINPNVRFCLYQDFEEYEVQPLTPYDIVKFYNDNWTGNKDFMHIPDYDKTIRNIEKFPIIIAYDTESKEILGISTLQYDEISKNHVDPYFPEENARYFSMTGILTNRSNKSKGLKGIGNKIYEIELYAALCYKQDPRFKDTRIMCVIDCRNKHSIFALKKATNNLERDIGLTEKGMEFPSLIEAFYFINDSEGILTEAPTLVMEVELEPKRKKEIEKRTIEYYPSDNINDSLLKTVIRTFKRDKTKKPIINFDMELDGAQVTYVKLDQDANYLASFPEIMTHNTEMGNDRIPLTEEELVNQFIEGSARREEKRLRLLYNIDRKKNVDDEERNIG